MDSLSTRFEKAIDALEFLVDELRGMEDAESRAPAAPAQPSAQPPAPTPVQKLAWGKKLSPEFKAGILWIRDQIGLKPDFLTTCMAFETGGTFSPSIKNPVSSATGLIQFMDATVKAMARQYPALASMAPNGRARDLASLTAVQQLSWVYYYFKAFGSDLSNWSVEDVYMAILLPVMIGKPLDAPMKWSQSAYRVNRGLDLDKNGTVTKREATGNIRRLYQLGMSEENYG